MKRNGTVELGQTSLRQQSQYRIRSGRLEIFYAIEFMPRSAGKR